MSDWGDELEALVDAKVQAIVTAMLADPSFAQLVRTVARPEFYRSSTIVYPTVPLVKDVETSRVAVILGPLDLKAGDVLDIHGIIQTTNENSPLSVAWNCRVTLNVGGAYPVSGQLGVSTGRNLLSDIHHDGLTPSKCVVLTQDYPNAYIALSVGAKPLVGGGSVPAGAVLNINYGELTAAITRL